MKKLFVAMLLMSFVAVNMFAQTPAPAKAEKKAAKVEMKAEKKEAKIEAKADAKIEKTEAKVEKKIKKTKKVKKEVVK